MGLNFPREIKNDRNANDTVHYASDICLFLSLGNSMPSREAWHGEIDFEWHRKWSADLFIKNLKKLFEVFFMLKIMKFDKSNCGEYKISTFVFDWLLSQWLSTTLHKKPPWKEKKVSLRLAGIMSCLLEMFSYFSLTITNVWHFYKFL